MLTHLIDLLVAFWNAGPNLPADASFAVAPIVVAGGIAAGSAIANLLSNRRSSAEKASVRRLREAGTEAQVRAGHASLGAAQTRAQYQSRLDAFDPHEALAGEADAFGQDITEDFNAADLGRRQMLNRRGFYGANLGAGHLNREVASRIARESARLSSRAADLEMQKTDRYGRLYDTDLNREDDARNEYLDLLAADRDYEMGRRRERGAAVSGAIGSGARTYGALAGGR